MKRRWVLTAVFWAVLSTSAIAAPGAMAPTKPAPATPAPTKPAPATPAPTAPAPTKPAPTTPPTAELKPGWKPTATISFDTGAKKKVYVGDVIRVRIAVIARAEISVNLPLSLDLGDFSQVGRPKVRTERLDGDKTKHEFVLRVAAFGVGQVKLPAIPITYVPPRKAYKGLDPNSAVSMPALQVTTEPLVQHISSVLANEPHPQLKKNAPPVEIMVEDRRLKIILLVVAGILAGVALGFLLFFLLRRRRARWVPPPPRRPAHEIALEKLVLLRSAGYLDRGEFKPFYFGVSEAIREYLGNRYDFDSLELTTTELMDEMRPVAMAGVDPDELLKFLLDCDLVKFAKYIPPLEDAQRIVSQAEHIVHASKLIPRSDAEDAEDSRANKPAEAPHG